MGMRSLAEAVIFRSIEDLYEDKYRAESLRFFSGPEFSHYAKLAGMDYEAQLSLLHMVSKIKATTFTRVIARKFKITGRANPSPHALPVPSH